MGTEKNLAGIYGGIGGGDRYTNPDKSIVTPVCDFLVVSPMSFSEIGSVFDPLLLGTLRGAPRRVSSKRGNQKQE